MALHLTIRGFSRHAPGYPEIIQRLLSSVPRSHLSGLREILYSPLSAQLYPGITAIQHTVAEYCQEQRKIVLYKIPDHNTLAHVLYHELGHHVFHTQLSIKKREQWTKKIRPSESHITDYAKTNPSEDFAESYALYVRSPNLFRQYPKRMQFFKASVFR